MIVQKILALIGGGFLIVSAWSYRDNIQSILEAGYEIAAQAKSASTLPLKSPPKYSSKQAPQANVEVQSIVKRYFVSLNNQDYGTAYSLLSPGFIQEKKLDLKSYGRWWAQISEVQSGEITLVSGAKDETYTVHTTLLLSPDLGFLNGKVVVKLVPVGTSWKIDKVRPNGSQ